ncbi:hypothetical protein CAL7716_061280 [Calothrix sp. PCC 7716]|nr:hypothetical protein CAL7716_061280 [Calothrix sp. PCC 7716]
MLGFALHNHPAGKLRLRWRSLDAKGNSIRGIKVCEHLSIDFGLHISNAAKPKLILEDLIEGVNSAQRGTSLIGTSLIGANLIGANLMGEDLTRKDLVRAYLSGANLIGANLMGKDLTGANFIGANLSRANLSGANLSEANLYKANLNGTNLNGTNLSGTNLIGTNLIAADFSGANLSGADLSGFDLSGVKLSGANLTGVNLTGVNLSGLDLSGANLSGANLSKAQALETDFTGAKFTGACLENWNINSASKLNDINCQYIYLRNDKQECRPSSREFAPGEFTKLFQKSLETVDLIFRNGIDWKAFAYSFKNTRILNQNTPLEIQSIENKDEVVLIRVSVVENADKSKIEGDIMHIYELAHKALDALYQERLLDKDKVINNLFYTVNQLSEKLGEVPKIMAEQPKVYQSINGKIYGGVAGNVEGNQNIYPSEQKQTLSEAATEIQRLLKQLEKTNPTATQAEQNAYVTESISPKLRTRCLNALQAGWKEAVKEFLDNSYINVGIAILEGWKEAE